MARRLTARGERRRQQLTDFAARQFAAQGYHPTSVTDIVDGLGVGKGVFYWYFPSKEDLFEEILRSAHRDLRRRQQAAIGDEPDPVIRIELGIRASLNWFQEHRAYFNLFQFAATEDRFRTVLRRNQAEATADAARHIKDGIVSGRIPDQEPEMLAQCIVGVTEQLAYTYLLMGDEPVDAVSDAAVAFCRHGVGA